MKLTQTRKEDLAWAAGFMDGEAHFGLVTVNRKTGNKHLHIQVCQTEDGPLQRLQQIFSVGKIYGPYKPKETISKRRPYKQYHIDAYDEVKMVIEAIWPWLSEPKRLQAKTAITSFVEYLQNRPRATKGPRKVYAPLKLNERFNE